MTRINVVPVEELTREHLVAEYRELPRTFALAHKAHESKRKWWVNQPAKYTLGTGHVLFFYNRLTFLSKRHQELVKEMLRRNYSPNFTEDLKSQWVDKIPANYWHDYEPTEEALRINRERIADRLTKK